MKRALAIVAVVSLAVAVPSAFGLARVLIWRAPQNEGIDLQFNIKKGHPTKITRLEFANIPATCVGFQPTAVSDGFAKPIRIPASGKFSAKETTNSGRVTYTVSGRFVSLHKAVGKLRIKGTVPGCLKADTGTVHWTAKG